jgi:hypothetical protein
MTDGEVFYTGNPNPDLYDFLGWLMPKSRQFSDGPIATVELWQEGDDKYARLQNWDSGETFSVGHGGSIEEAVENAYVGWRVSDSLYPADKLPDGFGHFEIIEQARGNPYYE